VWRGLREDDSEVTAWPEPVIGPTKPDPLAGTTTQIALNYEA
jgi:hypothetical protein